MSVTFSSGGRSPAFLTGVAALTLSALLGAAGPVWAGADAPAVPADRPAAPGADAGAGAGGRSGPPDDQLGWSKGKWGDDSTKEGEKASADTGSWKADKDLGSLFSLTKQSAAFDATGKKVTGRGVGVALIDTGVSPVTGLDGAGKVVNGPDLSFDSQSDTARYLDGYGHGTHLAAIIAGSDPRSADLKREPRYFDGVAPDARIVNVKVASADGGTDVSQVIAGIDWVVAHRADNGNNIRVINLSYGTDSVQGYQLDPLAHAVEAAWRQGIVVVVAAGNGGATTSRLDMPAADPYVIAVGASDHRGSDKVDDDTVADFTSMGSPTRQPDLLAPGKSVVSLRVPGSLADREHPEGLVDGDAASRFFRGSGTSQSAAVVSGAVALLLQQRPGLSPDQVKALLTGGAKPLKVDGSANQGAGTLDVKAALEAKTPGPDKARQTWPASTGLGSLEAARGSSRVVDPVNGVVLTGEQDIFGQPWDASRWSAAAAAGSSWSGGTWNASRWSGDTWSANSWSASRWSGTAWSGVDWSAHTWSASRWSASRWSDEDWSASRWSASRWSSESW